MSHEDRDSIQTAFRKIKLERAWRLSEFYNETLFRLPAIRQGQTHALHGNKVYMYYWKYPSALPDLGACHAVELAYVFNNLEDTVYTGAGVNAALADKVQRMWVSFALTGDPSIPEIRWEPYTGESRRTMLLDTAPRLETDPLATARELLYPLTEYRINGSKVSFTPFLLKLAARAGAAAAGIGAAAALTWLLLRKK